MVVKDKKLGVQRSLSSISQSLRRAPFHSATLTAGLKEIKTYQITQKTSMFCASNKICGEVVVQRLTFNDEAASVETAVTVKGVYLQVHYCHRTLRQSTAAQP